MQRGLFLGSGAIWKLTVAVLAALHLTTAAAGAAEPSPARAPIAEAFEAAQWASLSQAGKAVQQLGLRQAAGDPALAALVRQRQDLSAQAAAREATLAAGAGGAEAIRLRGEIDTLRAEIAALDRRLASEFPRYGELANPVPADIASVQAALRDDEALLFFLTTGEATFVWAIGRTQAVWLRSVFSRDYLTEEVTRVRAGLDPTAAARGASGLARPAGPRVAPFDRMSAYFIYTQLIEPLEPVLAGKRHIFVVADGPLAALPLSTLVSRRPTGADDDPKALAETAWLARRFAFTTLPTVASLAVIRSARQERGPPMRRFMGFGAPVLGDAAQASDRGAGDDTYFRGAYANVAAVRALPSLPQTGPELRRLAATLGAPDESVRLAEAATETAVKGTDLSSVGVLAFATHGLLSGEISGLAQPALVLTPPDVASVEDDGLLTASEIAELKLSADWVILSACNTAGGDGRPDAEGLSGLARAFLYAGARSILVSHWPVRDDAAARLTTASIAAVERDPAMGRSEALRLAMLELMQDRRDPTLAHPSAWAPFVVVGEGGGR